MSRFDAAIAEQIWDMKYRLKDANGTAIDKRFSNDALHLNGEGYRVWKEIIEGLLVENG